MRVLVGALQAERAFLLFTRHSERLRPPRPIRSRLPLMPHAVQAHSIGEIQQERHQLRPLDSSHPASDCRAFIERLDMVAQHIRSTGNHDRYGLTGMDQRTTTRRGVIASYNDKYVLSFFNSCDQGSKDAVDRFNRGFFT